jgi:hypothetical protein
MSKSDFNVFEVLDITHENYCSRVLAWLLDPTASHRQKAFLLKWLLKVCEIPSQAKYEGIWLEELIGNAEDDTRQRTDIALRCEDYLAYIEVKKDNRAISQRQVDDQYRFGVRRAEEQKRKFVHVLLTPDDTVHNLISLRETRHVTWSEVRDALQKQVDKLEDKMKRQKTSSAQIVVLDFLRQFVDRVDKRILIGKFRGLDPNIFKRRVMGLGGYIDELSVRSSLGDFLAAVRRRVEKNLPSSVGDVQVTIGTRSGAGCYLYYYFCNYPRLNIQLFFDLVAESATVGLWLNNARHRPKLLPELEARQPELVGINAKWPKKGAWAAIGPDIWDIENSHKMLDQAVEQLALYLKVFGPVIKAYVKRVRLGTTENSRLAQAAPEDEDLVIEVPYPPDEKTG